MCVMSGAPTADAPRVHGQPPPPVLLCQASIDRQVCVGQQAGQAREAQVAGGSLLARGEPRRRPARRGLSTVQLLGVQATLIPRPMTACTGTVNAPLASARPTTPPSECPSTTVRALMLTIRATAAAKDSKA